MDNKIEITPFLFLDGVEKLFKAEIEAKKDLQNGTVELRRVINLFDKSASLRVQWRGEDAVETVELCHGKIQSIAHKGRGYAFNVFINRKGGVEALLSLVPDEETLEKESDRIFQYLKAYTLMGLQERLPDVKLEEDPDELLLKVNPNHRKKPKKEEKAEKSPKTKKKPKEEVKEEKKKKAKKKKTSEAVDNKELAEA